MYMYLRTAIIWALYISSCSCDDNLNLVNSLLKVFKSRNNKATAGQFPHHVSVYYGGFYVCGGAILSKNFVVTSGSCVTQPQLGSSRPNPLPVEGLTVRVGSTELYDGGTILGVSKVIVHYKNLVALVKLDEPLTFDANASAIAVSSVEPPKGASVIVTGWNRFSSHLEYSRRRVANDLKCSINSSLDNAFLCLDSARSLYTLELAQYDGGLVGLATWRRQKSNFFLSLEVYFIRMSYFLNWLKANSDL